MGKKFLGGVKLTGYMDTYPGGRQTVKKYAFLAGLCFSVSTSNHQGNIFSLSAIISLTIGDHQKNFSPVSVKPPGKL
jgi:hypothetical protein